MDNRKKKKLEAAGWRAASADEFLDLTAEESALVDLRLALGRLVRATRQKSRPAGGRSRPHLSYRLARIAFVVRMLPNMPNVRCDGDLSLSVSSHMIAYSRPGSSLA